MAKVDFSLLDVPRSAPVEDPGAYLQTALAWHFGEDTGSAFWLRTAKTLDFNPLTDIKTFEDLRLFPNLVNELRTVPVEDLVRAHYAAGNHDAHGAVFEDLAPTCFDRHQSPESFPKSINLHARLSQTSQRDNGLIPNSEQR